jgi:hypothetical protein
MGKTRQSFYTDEQLLDNAKLFKTRQEWATAGDKEVAQGQPSHHRVALKRGIDFYRKCCAHMPNLRGTATPVRYSDDEIAASASKFQHRNDWKEAEPHYYQAAHRRGLIDKVAARMTLQAHPYSGSYIVYAYEFSDRHAYVGLTFLPKTRHIQHMVRGPVFEHMKICPTYSYKVVAEGLANPDDTAAKERHWVEAYRQSGWTLLNTAKAGGLGSVAHNKWTKEAVLANAKEFKTRKEWYLKSQFTYSLAKREGWFEQAASHMPRRVLGIGAGREVSQATRDKQSAAKTGVKQSTAHRASRAAAVKKWWADRRAKPAAESIVSTLLTQ